jgi:chromosomal replication initiation ATPase DnaA
LRGRTTGEEITEASQIRREFEVNKEQIDEVVESIERKKKPARKISVYMMRKYTSCSLKEIAAKYDKVGKYGVSKIYNRLEEKRREDKGLDEKLGKIEERINKMSNVQT